MAAQMSKFPFLLLIAIGDAYGMKYEFVAHARNKDTADLVYGPHPVLTAYRQGRYTDDTQMSLANAELLIANAARLSALTEDDFINAWIAAFRRDPHEGYSKYMWEVLSTVENADGFKSMIDAKQGRTSGAAMRAGPFGLLADVEQVKALTSLQGRITHDTPAGINAALAVALTVHFLYHGGSRGALPDFLERHIGADWNKDGYEESPNNGLKIVSQALDALRGAKTFSEALLNVVNNDELSDTDTICAMVMAMASRCGDIMNDLSAELYEGLETGVFGRDYLLQISRKLEAKFPPSEKYTQKPRPTPAGKQKLSL